MRAQRPDKETIYKWIRVSGLLTLIPISLFVGPIAGYAAGDWLANKFNLPIWTSIICSLFGFLGGALETIRIIRVALKSIQDKDS